MAPWTTRRGLKAYLELYILVPLDHSISHFQYLILFRSYKRIRIFDRWIQSGFLNFLLILKDFFKWFLAFPNAFINYYCSLTVLRGLKTFRLTIKLFSFSCHFWGKILFVFLHFLVIDRHFLLIIWPRMLPWIVGLPSGCSLYKDWEITHLLPHRC